MVDSKVLNDFAKAIHEQNKNVGWWDGEQSIYTKMQLISTEIAEATEGERKDLMDDHLPHRKMGEVELADALIRTLDIGTHLGCRVDQRDANLVYIDYDDGTIAGLHLSINSALIDWADDFTMKEPNGGAYSKLVILIQAVADRMGYNIYEAAVEKVAYNAKRADHKRENRVKPGGKAF